jgi:sugar/nucleoside kinase (ribokinase family)
MAEAEAHDAGITGAPLSEVIVAGHLCLDVIPGLGDVSAEQFRQAFVPGHLLESGPAALSTGGAASNVGLALHRLGISTRIMGKIGTDPFGQVVQSILRGYGPALADGLIVDAAAHTSYSVVINPPEVDRIFIHCPGANDTFGADDICYELLQDARLFHFGYPPLMRRMYQNGGQETAAVYRRAKATGVTTALDMSMPDQCAPAGRADWRTILRAALPYVDVFLPSIEEIFFMLRRDEYNALSEAAGADGILSRITPALLESLSRELLEMGVAIVGIKLGHRGFYLRTGPRAAIERMGRARPADVEAWANRQYWAPCFQAHVAGTVGAGDCTIAGFLAGLLHGLPPAQALIAGTAVGACNVEASDAVSGVRTWDETMARVAAGWPQHFEALDGTGWGYDSALKVYRPAGT